MNKDKLILDAIKEEAYRVNRTERPVYGQGQYDMAYIILDKVQKIIQSETEVIEHDACKGCQHEDKNNDEYPCNCCKSCYIDQYKPKKEKNNFDVITESPAKVINYFFHLMRQVAEKDGYEFTIEPDAVEKWIDYLNQKAGE